MLFAVAELLVRSRLGFWVLLTTGPRYTDDILKAMDLKVKVTLFRLRHVDRWFFFKDLLVCSMLLAYSFNRSCVSAFHKPRRAALYQMYLAVHFYVVWAPLLWQTTSELWCLSGGKRGDYQNCSVLYCVFLKLYTVTSTLRWAVLTVLWLGFCHTRPISLCVDFVVFIYV